MSSNTIRLGILFCVSAVVLGISSVGNAQAEEKRGCTYHRVSYSHGETREDSRGNKYKCDNGVWRRVSDDD